MIVPVENIKAYPRLSINRFTDASSIRSMRYAEPYKWADDYGEVKLEKGWRILGWNYAKKLPWKQSELKQDMLVVMFESPDGEDVWSHFIEATDLIWAKNEKENKMIDDTTKLLREQIIEKRKKIDLLRFEINAIAENYIADFDFLKHKISTVWICDSSPIGMCVFNLDREGLTLDCRYCGSGRAEVIARASSAKRTKLRWGLNFVF